MTEIRAHSARLPCLFSQEWPLKIFLGQTPPLSALQSCSKAAAFWFDPESLIGERTPLTGKKRYNFGLNIYELVLQNWMYKKNKNIITNVIIVIKLKRRLCKPSTHTEDGSSWKQYVKRQRDIQVIREDLALRENCCGLIFLQNFPGPATLQTGMIPQGHCIYFCGGTRQNCCPKIEEPHWPSALSNARFSATPLLPEWWKGCFYQSWMRIAPPLCSAGAWAAGTLQDSLCSLRGFKKGSTVYVPAPKFPSQSLLHRPAGFLLQRPLSTPLLLLNLILAASNRVLIHWQIFPPPTPLKVVMGISSLIAIASIYTIRCSLFYVIVTSQILLCSTADLSTYWDSSIHACWICQAFLHEVNVLENLMPCIRGLEISVLYDEILSLKTWQGTKNCQRLHDMHSLCQFWAADCSAFSISWHSWTKIRRILSIWNLQHVQKSPLFGGNHSQAAVSWTVMTSA